MPQSQEFVPINHSLSEEDYEVLYESQPTTPTTGGVGGSGQSVTTTNDSQSVIGDAPFATSPGSQIVQEEVPGNLGSTAQTLAEYLILRDSTRSNSNQNIMVPWNHRYRGHRESFKFNLNIQQIIAGLSKLIQDNIKVEELFTDLEGDSYLADDDLADLSHVCEQVRFQEWIRLKDNNVRWYF